MMGTQPIWARWPGEPASWYSRFQVYLHLGPNRTILAAYRRSAQLEGLAAPYPHPGWRRNATRWQWARRAVAWDAHQEAAAPTGSEAPFEPASEQPAMDCVQERDSHPSPGTVRGHMYESRSVGESGSEGEDPHNAHGTPAEDRGNLSALQPGKKDPERQRFAMVDRLLAVVYAVILHAELEGMTSNEARRALPTLRMFFKDLLQAHQQEAAKLQGGEGAQGSVAAFSADELRRAHRELERWRAIVGRQTGHWSREMPQGGGSPGAPPERDDNVQRDVADEGFGPPAQVTAGPGPSESWLPLRDVLAALYGDEAGARRIAGQAGVDRGRIRFGDTAIDRWHAILSEAVKMNRLDAVIEVVMDEYGANRQLVDAVGYLRG